MSRKRKPIPLNQWETPKEDPKTVQHYARIDADMDDDPVFSQLLPSEKYFYLTMVMKSAGHQEFTFSQADYKRHGFKKTNAIKTLKKLMALGFIRLKKWGYPTREPNRYEWCYDWKKRPTNDTGKNTDGKEKDTGNNDSTTSKNQP